MTCSRPGLTVTFALPVRAPVGTVTAAVIGPVPARPPAVNVVVGPGGGFSRLGGLSGCFRRLGGLGFCLLGGSVRDEPERSGKERKQGRRAAAL